MIKRTFDILTASLGLMVCLPLFVVVALLIKLDSPGPIFFMQARMGRGFQRFFIYKFRTMVPASTPKGGLITIGQDSRITRVGQCLRKYKIDELPQLANVLKGEMSVVGPRPEVPNYVEMFKEKYEEILTVRPGLTDLASLKYIDEPALLEKAENPEEEYRRRILPEKLRLASRYIEHASFLFDLALIAQTLINLLGVRVIVFDLPELQNPVEWGDHSSPSKAGIIIQKYRRPLLVTLDICLIVLANYLAFWLRFDGDIPQEQKILFLQMVPWLIFLRGMAFFQFRLNEALWRYTSIWDLQRLVTGVVISTLVFYALVHVGFGFIDYPNSIFIMDSLLLISFCVGVRLPVRLLRERVLWRAKKKVLIIGAGDVGERIVREIKAYPSFRYAPIGFLDDQTSMVGQRIHGVQVLGTLKDLSRILAEKKPKEIWVAPPEGNPTLLREIIASLESSKVSVKALPNLKDLLESSSAVSQIRNFSLEDLLPRMPVGSKTQTVRHMIEGKRILITGAGGSIGSELCRQVAELQPEALVLYERHENSLYTIGKELADLGYSSLVYPVIGDVTDADRLRAIMQEHRPHIMFHAAAHKHVPMMELNPGEAFKNNCLGTRIAAEAGDEFGIQRFVLISTDKAVNPSSVMGATKRVAELVVQDMAHHSKTRFLTVRFGNVLGSNGSVVPRFQEQIKAGGPVTVTHPEVRRYFMLIPEAVHLILQAASLSEQGAIYVLDMGEQIKLLDLARNLIRLSGFVPDKEIPITFVGLRPGEKLDEELVGEDEKAEPSSIHKVFRIRTKATPKLRLLTRKLTETGQKSVFNSSSWVISRLQELVPALRAGEINGNSRASRGAAVFARVIHSR